MLSGGDEGAVRKMLSLGQYSILLKGKQTQSKKIEQNRAISTTKKQEKIKRKSSLKVLSFFSFDRTQN